ncbi:hypothetical protein [Streptomyces sp. NPDC002790]|uniref:hypothetical protein n=1 Tax=Streptomyces sp. NPDC002790 TaxID=3154431 RepID=UPI00332B7D6C
MTGPGVAVGATFGVWFGVGAAGLWSPVGVGFAVGAGRVGAWASVAVALCVWNVGLDDVREDESEPVWAPAPTPVLALGMELDVAEVEVGDEASVGVGVPTDVAVVMGCWAWVRGSVAVDGSLPRSGEAVCAAGPLDSWVGVALSDAVLMPWDGSDCPTGGVASGVGVGAGDGVAASASTRACGTEEGWSEEGRSDCAAGAGAGVAVSPPLRCASVPVDTSGVPDDDAASGVDPDPGEESGVLEGPGEPPISVDVEACAASRCSL